MNKIRVKILKRLWEGKQMFLELLKDQESTINFLKELHFLYKENLITLLTNKYFTLTEKGKEYVINLKLSSEKVRCNVCQGKGIDLSKYQDILIKFKEIVKNRPLPINEYDQGAFTPEDGLRRVLFMLERGDLEGEKILILGDDDLISIVIGLMKVAEKITVVEIDQRLIEFIKVTDLNIETILYNAEESLILPTKYNTFITDPVETVEGWKLFLSRGISCLDKFGVVYFGLTSIECSKKKWYEFQKLMGEMGLVITDILRNFSTYSMITNALKYRLEKNEHFIPEKIRNFLKEFLFSTKNNYENSKWYTSSFVRAEAIDQPQPLVIGNYKLGNAMYRDNNDIEIENYLKKFLFEIYKDSQNEKR